MTRLSDGMVVQARLHLNQGVDANLRSLGINISYLIFFRFHLFFFVYVLIVIVLLIGSHLRQQKGLERQLRKLVGAPLAHPSVCLQGAWGATMSTAEAEKKRLQRI